MFQFSIICIIESLNVPPQRDPAKREKLRIVPLFDHFL